MCICWEYKNCAGQREQFMCNCGPWNEAQNETYCGKMLLINWWV